MMVPHRVAIALQENGWILRGDTVWEKPNPMPSPVKDRMNEVKEYVFHLTPSSDYWFDLNSVREPYTEQTRRRARRAQKRGVKRRTDEAPGNHAKSGGIHDESVPRSEQMHPEGKNPGDVWEISVKSFPEAHFAVYPPELCKRPIKSSCPPKVCAECGTPYDRKSEVVEREVGGGSPAIPDEETGYSELSGNHQGDYGERTGFTQPTKREIGPWEKQCDCATDETEPGIVIDPFAGAGTTCLVAKRLGRRFVGIDLNPEYVAMAQKRVGITVDEPDRLLDESETSLTAFTDGGRP
jgi:DNA modification methylase